MQQAPKQQAVTNTRQSNEVMAVSAYRAPRYHVTLVGKERGESSRVTVRDSTSAASVMRPCFAGLDREHFLVLGLDAKHCVIGINVVSIGSFCLAIVHPREVFKPLILMNAAAWICAHNHPSGDVMPSEEDRALTKRLREAGELLGINLLDHLILANEHSYSFADQGWPI